MNLMNSSHFLNLSGERPRWMVMGGVALSAVAALSTRLTGAEISASPEPPVIQHIIVGARPEALPAGANVIVTWGDLPDIASLRTALAPHVGRVATRTELEVLGDLVTAHLTRHDRPAVFVPVQPATAEGVVEIQVAVGHVRSVEVVGGKHLHPRALAAQLESLAGQPLTGELMVSAVEWLNRDPLLGARIAPVAAELTSPTSFPVDLAVQVTDAWPVRVTLGMDNRGVAPLGETRLFSTVEWTPPLALAQRWALTSVESPDFRSLRGQQAQWTLSLPWRQELTVAGSLMQTDLDYAHDAERFEIDGESWQGSLTWRRPFRFGLHSTVEALLGWEGRRYTTDVAFGGASVFDQALSVSMLTAGLSGRTTGERWGLGWSVQGLVSPGEGWGTSEEAKWSAISPGVSDVFWAVRSEVASQWALGQHGAYGSLSLRTGGQWSDQPLPASEKLGVTGSAQVRGTRERSLTAARAVWGALEWATPWWSPTVMKRVGWPTSVQALAFADAGLADDPQSPQTTATAVGLGLRLQVASHLSGQLDVAWPDGSEGPRAHFSLQATF
jgi:hemolysin activation/secretion protein